ncbi:Double-strand break repair protein mre11a [Modicella reniformis]|uniref:Double-strand break repair protein n=1 Tax=Modicella reniformis TaxID=1440133 RepID=A0A9P6J251_9FUNG|nr:Double-strand break repair protein mre11a [Modicella reniformis]
MVIGTRSDPYSLRLEHGSASQPSEGEAFGDGGDTFSILMATDNHLGYLEKDPVRGGDSFAAFEEILSLAAESEVDMILLGGDLFHENKPSRKTMYLTTKLLRKHCLGDKPVSIEFLSDPKDNFPDGVNNVNYMDPNLNIAIPVFSIHGNHDDPSGDGNLCALDQLSMAGLVNYFGRSQEIDNVVVRPILLQKGASRLALYGIGNIRDERLHQTFLRRNVKMMRPVDDDDEEPWYNLLVLHQNRVMHGPKSYIPEAFLDDFINLVIWGHEHECLIDPVYNPQQGFHVRDLVQQAKENWIMKNGRSSRKRRMYNMDESDDDEIIQDADKSQEVEVPKPLVRLRVEYSGGYEIFNPQRFGQEFVDIVANPRDIVHFFRKKTVAVGKPDKAKAEVDVVDASEKLDTMRVENLVQKYLSAQNLSVLPEVELADAVRVYVEKDEKDAINKEKDIQADRYAREHPIGGLLDHRRSTQRGDMRMDVDESKDSDGPDNNAVEDDAADLQPSRTSKGRNSSSSVTTTTTKAAKTGRNGREVVSTRTTKANRSAKNHIVDLDSQDEDSDQHQQDGSDDYREPSAAGSTSKGRQTHVLLDTDDEAQAVDHYEASDANEEDEEEILVPRRGGRAKGKEVVKSTAKTKPAPKARATPAKKATATAAGSSSSASASNNRVGASGRTANQATSQSASQATGQSASQKPSRIVSAIGSRKKKLV